jgi:hypothetical protein
MNHAEKAKELQQERLERERLAKDRQAREKQEAAERELKMSDLAKQKTEELLSLFKQFTGFKIGNGHVTLEAEVKYPAGTNALMCLKAGSVGLSVMDRYRAGMVLIGAHYVSESETYQLHRHDVDAGARGASRVVGDYKNTDELMNAVAQEVSRL